MAQKLTVTTNTAQAEIYIGDGRANIFAHGTWGGATATLEIKTLHGNWKAYAAYTADTITTLSLMGAVSLRWNITGGTAHSLELGIT